MITLGFYQNEDELLTMIEPLISLLDGSNDFHSQEDEAQFNQKKKQLEEQAGAVGTVGVPIKLDKKKTYMQCTENETLILIKRKIIDILTIIMNMQDDIRLTSFLIQFNKSDDIMVKDPFKSAAVLKYLQNVLSG